MLQNNPIDSTATHQIRNTELQVAIKNGEHLRHIARAANLIYFVMVVGIAIATVWGCSQAFFAAKEFQGWKVK